MEASKNYVDFYDLVSSVTRIANNLDKMMEIMSTTSIKMDPEKARSVLNEWYGTMVMDEVQKKFWTANEIGKKEEEIQDLKLENDRLSKRNDKMWYALRAIACVPDCEVCMLRGSKCDEIAMKDLAVRTLTELEEL